jgi:hypothetical protein
VVRRSRQASDANRTTSSRSRIVRGS